MDIPIDVLNKLHCDMCKNHLSCGPIYLNYKLNKVICGRCNPKFPKMLSTNLIRYTHYETLASAVQFPCKFARNGCKKKLYFSCECPHKHEETCEYRKRACPIISSKTEPNFKCQWCGRNSGLLQHCKLAHPDKVLTNPCVFKHVYDHKTRESYLITCFNTLFLLTVVISDDIMYKCRHLGSSNLYKFVVKVSSKSTTYQLIKDGAVVPETSTSQPNLTLNINQLKTIYPDSAMFCFTIENITQKITQIPNAENAICCRFHNYGCVFVDVPEKTKKHELFFCRFLSECPECNKHIGNLCQHLIAEHRARRVNNGHLWHITEGYKQYCVLVDHDVYYVCKFSLACFRLLLSVYTPYASQLLPDYTCEVRINDPGHCYKHKLVPVIDGVACFDWSVNINMYNYPLWRHYGLDLAVFIGKRHAL